MLDQYVVSDSENGSVAIQDLEDISDREFLCVNDDGPAVRDGNYSDGVRSCEHDRHGDDGHGAADSGASDSETVIGGDVGGLLSGIEAVNSDDGRVENSSRMSVEDSVMDTDDDMVDVGEGSVDNDDDSDKGDSDRDELDYSDDADDDGDGVSDGDGDSSDAMDETEAEDSDVIVISDEEENDVRTVAVPEITRVVRSVTLPLRRTTTYSHGNIILVETEYLWEGNQTRTSS